MWRAPVPAGGAECCGRRSKRVPTTAACSVCALAVSAFAIIAAAEQSGPFHGHALLTNMITLQAFNGSAALTALLLGVVVSERNQTQQEIARACGQLADLVARMATGNLRPALPHRQDEREEQGGQTPRRA